MEQHLPLYRVFYTVANTGNISQAAKLLYNSQPAISKSISRLEDSLGVPLFTRSSKGVSLTEEGKILYSHLKTAFDAIDAGEAQLQRMHDLDMGSVRIGVSSTLCRFFLLPYLKSFIEQYPNIRLEVVCQATGDTLEQLESDRIDIGLIAKPQSPRSLHFFSLGSIEDIFVASPTYLERMGLKRGEAISGRLLFEKATLMLLDKKNMTRQYIDDYLTENHMNINNQVVATSMELLIEFAKIGLGVGCVIKEFVEDELKEGSLVEIPLDIPIHKREVGFAYISSQHSRAVSHFIDFYNTHKEL